ncbi:hypothetical protein [Sphingopyxis sp. LK2115]|uniref:hypothetical protein n=1 Tax=Sphingopyxis sp. LK2115 TaxID=2744558 RepID=UPI0016605EB3|nr:hypothetical protein [Sphingopyxis sp. LK2115]
MSMLLAQAMVETIDKRPQRAVPATAFRCTMLAVGDSKGVAGQFDLHGTTPLAPEGHQPNDGFPIILGSSTGSALAGRGITNPIHNSDWFRDFQITRIVGSDQYVINLKLRREGRSMAYVTRFGDWPPNAAGEREPFRYDAVGICVAEFNPSEQPS